MIDDPTSTPPPDSPAAAALERGSRTTILVGRW
jgi:hypothetical protein